MLNRMSTNDLAVIGYQVTPGRHPMTGHTSNKEISIEFCNIRGLNSNLDSVHLNLQLSNPNLFLVTETQISPNNNINSSQFPGYQSTIHIII